MIVPMKALRELLTISGISLAAAGGTLWVKGPPQRRLTCEPSTLKQGEVCLEQIPPNEKILWIDARSRKGWEENGLPGAALWNLDPTEDMQAFEAEIASRIIETPRVIVYCGDENCGISKQVAERIRALGMGAEVSALRGGWRALDEAGRIQPKERIKDSNPKPSGR
jgi:rhodanese-related sulfurtransferase